MQQFAPHSRRRQASQFWLSPTIWLAKVLCARSANRVGIPRALPFLPLNLTASGKKSSWRRCPEFAGLPHLWIATPQRHHGCVRWKRRRAHGGVELSIHQVARREEIGSAIDAAKAAGAGALNVLASSLLFNSRAFIFDRVTALRLPTVYQWPEMAEQGGLIGYGPLIIQLYRDIMSRQLAKLLRGVKPADLPVEQPTRFELVINLRAAHAIGHDVPAGLVLRADKVIE